MPGLTSEIRATLRQRRAKLDRSQNLTSAKFESNLRSVSSAFAVAR
jgi:hypothetical protein